MTRTSYFSWNGLSAGLKGPWEVMGLKKRRLSVKNRREEVMDFTWSAQAGSRSFSDTLPRILKRISASGGTGPSKIKGPRRFAFPSFVLQEALEWEKSDRRVTAAVLECKTCGRRLLIQFSSPDNSATLFSRRDFLVRLNDHDVDRMRRWQVYDIQMALPSFLRLESFRFLPGLFELRFRHKKLALACFRWAAASVLLKDKDLIGFSRDFFNTGQMVSSALGHELHGDHNHEHGTSRRFVHRIFHKTRPSLFLRVRHDPGTNKILAMHLAGAGRGLSFLEKDRLLFSIWKTYECR